MEIKIEVNEPKVNEETTKTHVRIILEAFKLVNSEPRDCQLFDDAWILVKP